VDQNGLRYFGWSFLHQNPMKLTLAVTTFLITFVSAGVLIDPLSESRIRVSMQMMKREFSGKKQCCCRPANCFGSPSGPSEQKTYQPPANVSNPSNTTVNKPYSNYVIVDEPTPPANLGTSNVVQPTPTRYVFPNYIPPQNQSYPTASLSTAPATTNELRTFPFAPKGYPTQAAPATTAPATNYIPPNNGY
jgi:hypothetical protein